MSLSLQRMINKGKVDIVLEVKMEVLEMMSAVYDFQHLYLMSSLETGFANVLAW